MCHCWRMHATPSDKGPDSDSNDRDLAGLQLLLLLINSRSWAHRRVDALRLDLEGTTRRFISVDITIPEDLAIPADSRKRIVVPLGVMRKGAIQRLDARQDSRGLAVLGRADNSRRAVRMLLAAVAGLPRTEKALGQQDAELMERLVGSDSASAGANLEAYAIWKARTLEIQKFTDRDQRRLIAVDVLINRLVTHYIFLVEIDSDNIGVRTTVKYSLDQEMPLFMKRGYPIRFHFKLPDFGFAESQHMEVEVPNGLCLTSFDFVAFDERHIVRQVASEPPLPGSRIAHAVLNPLRSDLRGEVWTRAIPSREGIYKFANWAVAITTLLVIATGAARMFDRELLRPETTIPSPAASIVLIAPALLLSWMSRRPEHPLVIRLLAPLRSIVLACASILVAMAILAAVPVSVETWNVVWILIYLATLWTALYALTISSRYRRKSQDAFTLSSKGGSR